MRQVRPVLLVSLLALTAAPETRADIDPFIESDAYDPARWDSAGPYAATPWMHPPPYEPGMGLGMLDPRRAIESGDWQRMSGLSGSWGGARDDWMKRGFGFFLAYFGQLAANPIGGEVEGGVSWRGDLNAATYLDLERIAGWHRTYFTASADWKAGNPTLSATDIGNQFPVQLDSFDDPNAIRLVHLALAKELFANSTELTLGRVIAGEDFATLGLACTSLNQAICGVPIVGPQNISFPTFPNAVWGGALTFKPGDLWYLQAGSYLVWEDFRDRLDQGVAFSAPEGSGALTLVELGYAPGDPTQQPGLPGRYAAPRPSDGARAIVKLGAYYDTEDLPRFKESGEDLVSDFWGVYLMGQWPVWANPTRTAENLSLWGALSYAPPDRNRIEWMTVAGALYQGFFASRPGDGLALTVAYGSYSHRLQDRSGELLLDLNYRFAISPWFWIEPDLQGIVQPSGMSSIPDALVPGLAIGVVF